ncbi:MAG: hypothetical protein ACLPYS_07420, partial [Vulcanimicrobiaceae bacterium]
LTGGYLPLAATLATDEIYNAFLAPPHEGKTFVLPIVAAFLALESLWYIQLLDGIARFTIERPYYDSQVAELPRNGHRFAEFNWGGMSFASDGVVYDETDEVGLPSGRQSAAWFDRMKNTDLTCGENARLGPVHALGGHYYLASFGC